MAKTHKNKKLFFKLLKKYSLPTLLLVILSILIVVTYQVILQDKFSAFTFVGDVNISLLNQGQALKAFEGKFNKRSKEKLTFITPSEKFTLDLATASAKIDYSSFYDTFNSQHTNFSLEKLNAQITAFFIPIKIYPKISISLENQVDLIAKAVLKPYKNAEVLFNEIPNQDATQSAQIEIREGQDGIALDDEALNNQIISYLLNGKYVNFLPLKKIPPKVNTQLAQRAKQALEQTLKQPLKLTFEEKVWTIDAKQLLTLLDLTTGENLLNKDQTQTLIKNIAAEIDQEVQEGLFEFNPQTKKVTAFQPSRQGQKLNIDKTFKLLTDSLTSFQKTITLPVDIVKPKIQTEDINNLGIKELIGQGVSNFAGSIPNRIYNVNLTAQKINGVLIPPGEIFSFNKTVGDISAATGYKQAYVIKEGRTVLDDGGGVCQDSTTLYRAVLNAGLPVVARTAHAYRVGYYEQGFPPGLDATVFYPSVDFQFKNDTSHHILIQAYTSGMTLYIDLYGTSDGRVVTLTKPIVTNITPAPPELRQDDPTLPKGVVKQVDWAANGATVTFTRTVVKNGQTLFNETWRSNYKPWQAIFLVGTQ